MTVFVLTEQQYDCEPIHGIFKTMKAAKEAKKALLKKNKWESYIIEPYEVEE